ncbi:hypothetical protein JYU14_02320 [Simkania negevensis]|uniref:Secreted protein n=1 Tax=Simkania negevensis TaxID=83561 RepID=A0ABS3ARB3_9BACT|nr:hypothetical protein [Simkania negevensis]
MKKIIALATAIVAMVNITTLTAAPERGAQAPQEWNVNDFVSQTGFETAAGSAGSTATATGLTAGGWIGLGAGAAAAAAAVVAIAAAKSTTAHSH